MNNDKELSFKEVYFSYKGVRNKQELEENLLEQFKKAHEESLEYSKKMIEKLKKFKSFDEIDNKLMDELKDIFNSLSKSPEELKKLLTAFFNEIKGE